MELNEKLDAEAMNGPAAAPADEKTLVTTAKKELAILKACASRDFEALQALAESEGGFLTDELRRHAWLVLLGSPPEDAASGSSEDDVAAEPWKKLPRHRDEDQVKLDVDRAFVYYPENRSPSEVEKDKQQLSDLIVSVLRRYPYLCYFQGYHDICQVLLLVLPPSQAAPAAARLSALRIRDFMLPTLAPAIAQLRLLPAILHAADPPLGAHLSATEPFFALSGTLTMYAHDVTSLGAIARLFDALLARAPAFSVYVFARIVLDRRAELLATPASEPEMLHAMISKLPARTATAAGLDALIRGAAELCAAHPPETLGRAWRVGISSASALKTACSTRDCAAQTMEDGKAFFDRQVREMQWQERRQKALDTLWKYRRPVRTVGLAIIVGVLAVWLRRSPGPSAFLWTVLSRLRT